MEDDKVEHFGACLRRLRRQADITLVQLSKKCGFSVGYLGDLEAGRREPPSPEKVSDICTVLGPGAHGVLLKSALYTRKQATIAINTPDSVSLDLLTSLCRNFNSLSKEKRREILAILEPTP